MKQIILSSSGFDNKRIGDKFLSFLNKEPNNAKVLFITTAAITQSQIKMLPLCENELLAIGIAKKNIISYNFEYSMTNEELDLFDAIYVCGGDTQHLQNKIKRKSLPLAYFIEKGGLYFGVSAGSIAMTTTLENGFGLINCHLCVHQSVGSDNGKIQLDSKKNIRLTDEQAIIILGDEIEIFQ